MRLTLLFSLFLVTGFSQISVSLEGYKAYSAEGKTDGGMLMPSVSAYYQSGGAGHPWYIEGKLGQADITIGSDIYGTISSYKETYAGIGIGGHYAVNTETFIWTMDFGWVGNPYYGLTLRLDTPLQVGHIGLSVGMGITVFDKNRSGHLLGKVGVNYRL